MDECTKCNLSRREHADPAVDHAFIEGGYNGWANWETWNVALWIGNDEGLYSMARGFKDYSSFAQEIRELGMLETPDGASWTDSGLDHDALDEMLQEL